MEELMPFGHGRESNDLVCGRKKKILSIGSSIRSIESINEFIKEFAKVSDPSTFNDI